MRSRNIKPSFFKNEELADIPYEARLLFIGLWCMADREGRLENRPKRMKAELFPYDHINIEKMLDVITCHGLTLHYTKNGNQYIQIINFTKHQHPHPHESKSEIPPMSLQGQPLAGPAGLMLGCSDVRNPDIRNPESLSPAKPGVPPGAFNLIWGKYPRKMGKDAASDKFRVQVKTLQDWLDIQNALDNFVRKLQIDKTEEKFILHGSTWFNRRWHDWVNYNQGVTHGTDGSPSISHYTALARAARKSLGLREPPAGGAISSGVRNLPDVPSNSKEPDGTGKRGDVSALEIIRTRSAQIGPSGSQQNS